LIMRWPSSRTSTRRRGHCHPVQPISPFCRPRRGATLDLRSAPSARDEQTAVWSPAKKECTFGTKAYI
jgi:hypothetical protein